MTAHLVIKRPSCLIIRCPRANMNGTDCHSPSALGKLVCLVWTANVLHYWIFFLPDPPRAHHPLNLL